MSKVSQWSVSSRTERFLSPKLSQALLTIISSFTGVIHNQCWTCYSKNVIYYSLIVTPFKSNIVTYYFLATVISYITFSSRPTDVVTVSRMLLTTYFCLIIWPQSTVRIYYKLSIVTIDWSACSRVHDWGETLEQGTEPPTAPRAPQRRQPTALSVCALGWVKCREHISLLVIRCIIVYVINKNSSSLWWHSSRSIVLISLTIMCSLK